MLGYGYILQGGCPGAFAVVLSLPDHEQYGLLDWIPEGAVKMTGCPGIWKIIRLQSCDQCRALQIVWHEMCPVLDRVPVPDNSGFDPECPLEDGGL